MKFQSIKKFVKILILKFFVKIAENLFLGTTAQRKEIVPLYTIYNAVFSLPI